MGAVVSGSRSTGTRDQGYYRSDYWLPSVCAYDCNIECSPKIVPSRASNDRLVT